MIRTLRVLAAISFVWSAGFVLWEHNSPFGTTISPITYVSLTYVATLSGEMAFAVGILALAATASRRQADWFVLFAALLALLHVVPFFLFRGPASFLALSELLPIGLGQLGWLALLPALTPAAAFLYTLTAGWQRQAFAVAEQQGPAMAAVWLSPTNRGTRRVRVTNRSHPRRVYFGLRTAGRWLRW